MSAQGGPPPDPQTNLCDVKPYILRKLDKILRNDPTKLEDLKGCPDQLGIRPYQDFCLDDLTAGDLKSGDKLLAHWGNRGMTVQDLVFLLEEIQLERALTYLKPHESIQLIEQSSPFHSLEEWDCLILECKATGFPYPDYEWFHMVDSKHPTQVCAKHNDGRFKIDHVKMENAGRYICKMHNHEKGNDGKLIKVYSQYFEVVVTPCTKSPPPAAYSSDGVGSSAEAEIPGRPLITMQPEQSVSIHMGQELQLSCHAIGSAHLTYHWHKNDMLILSGPPELLIKAATLIDSGTYHCCIRNNKGKEVKTQMSIVKVFPHMQCWETKKPIILKQPTNKMDQIGGKVVFEVEAEGVGQIFYQWFKNGQMMAGETGSQLHIHIKDKTVNGTYQCMLSNNHQESIMTRVVTLQVEESQKQHTAQDKVALIMGVSEYKHQTTLKSIKNDVCEASKQFTNLGFKVVSLLDLTLDEMHTAVKLFKNLVDEGVYVIVYIAGHGFTCNGNHYFIPWDAPVQMQPSECLCLETVEYSLQEKKPSLLMFFVDMCRIQCNNVTKDQKENAIPEQPKKFLGNMVVFYASSRYEKAFAMEDLKNDCTSTHPFGYSSQNRSIFSTFLMNVIWQDLTIADLWKEFIREMTDRGEDMVQHPEMQANLAKMDRKLSDPIIYQGHTVAMNERVIKWQKGHTLPPSCVYKVENLGQFEIIYDQVASNILEIHFLPHFNHTIRRWGVTIAENKIPNEIKPIKPIKAKTAREENGECQGMEKISYRINSLQRLTSPLKLEINIAFSMFLGDGEQPLVQCECPTVPIDLGLPLISCVMGQHAQHPSKEPEEQEESETEEK